MLCAGHGPAAYRCVRAAVTTVAFTSPCSNLMEVSRPKGDRLPKAAAKRQRSSGTQPGVGNAAREPRRSRDGLPQAAVSEANVNEACAVVRTPQTRGATNRNRVRRADGWDPDLLRVGTTQDEVLYPSCTQARRLGARAWKVARFTPPVFALWATPWSSRRVSQQRVAPKLCERRRKGVVAAGETSR